MGAERTPPKSIIMSLSIQNGLAAVQPRRDASRQPGSTPWVNTENHAALKGRNYDLDCGAKFNRRTFIHSTVATALATRFLCEGSSAAPAPVPTAPITDTNVYLD